MEISTRLAFFPLKKVRQQQGIITYHQEVGDSTNMTEPLTVPLVVSLPPAIVTDSLLYHFHAYSLLNFHLTYYQQNGKFSSNKDITWD